MLAMAKSMSRRRLLCAVPPVVAAGPLALLGARASAAGGEHQAHSHAAMIGMDTPAPGGPNALDALLQPPPPLPHSPGRVREYTLTAIDRRVEVADGVFFDAWTYNGTVPGPVIRVTEDDLLLVRFVN